MDFERDSFFNIQMDFDVRAGLLSTSAMDPGRRPVTVATPYPFVSVSPRANAGNGENMAAGVMERRLAD